MFPNSFVSQSRCSPKVFPVPMFLKYIPQSLCSPVPMLPSPYRLNVPQCLCSPNKLPSPYVPQSLSPQPVHQVPMFHSPCLLECNNHLILIEDIWAILPKWVPPAIQKWPPPIYMKMHRRIHCCINSIYSKYRHSMNGHIGENELWKMPWASLLEEHRDCGT